MMKTERQQEQEVIERLRRENQERVSVGGCAPPVIVTNPESAAVEAVAWLVTNGGETCEPWLVYERNEVEALPASCIAEPLYSAATVAELRAEVERLNAIVNTPQANDFLRAVSTEAEHQRQRWGNDHDSGKTPADWFWLVGYLGGKALHAHAAGDVTKAEHHIITTAAALANWHLAAFGNTDMRPGIDGESLLGRGG